MDNELTTEYLDKVFGKTFFGGSRLLIWDSFRCHISVDTKDTLRRLEIHSAVVPGGTTKFIQAPDVCWNAPFKNAIREKYNDWMVNGEKPTTSTGNLKAPPMDIYLEWIASAWESIPKPLIEDSFLTCGITKEIDGRHDEKIHVFKKDGAIPNGLALLKQRRKEDAVIKGVEEIDLGKDESDASVDMTELLGVEERRKIQAELALGARENIASAKVRIECRIEQNYSDKTDEEKVQIRDKACGNAIATKKALYRSQIKRTMKVRTLLELQREESAPLWTTLRGRLAHRDSDHFQELFLLDCSNEIAIFSSPRQLAMLKKTRTIISDGTFKMAPRGIFQVYRVFGFVAHTHSVPLATALMRGKNGDIYSRFWDKIRQELDTIPGDLEIRQANFDYEPASVFAFQRVFPEVHPKMCVFHVKQALNRRIQRMGLIDLYNSKEPEGTEFQRIVRKIGALQFCPPNYFARSLQLIRQLITDSPLEIANRGALEEILIYYNDTWIKNRIGRSFFSLFDVDQHRTTNHAESYHGRQRHFYQPGFLLGRWIANFQELSHAEEGSAVAVDEGRELPSQPLQLTIELDNAIAGEKANILAFLRTDYDDEQFTTAMSNYYGRVGHLIGFNPVQRNELDEMIIEDDARNLAEQSLDENGLLNADLPFDELDEIENFELLEDEQEENAIISTDDEGKQRREYFKIVGTRHEHPFGHLTHWHCYQAEIRGIFLVFVNEIVKLLADHRNSKAKLSVGTASRLVGTTQPRTSQLMVNSTLREFTKGNSYNGLG
ncbi:hypothetical protein niasHT_009263 [Heterodera trifolii]|uniref:Transposase n=1 Tax=Heterodera trifolii TaxID=157864 RepID=A0ABD2MB26_9BILA